LLSIVAFDPLLWLGEHSPIVVEAFIGFRQRKLPPRERQPS
jgi:hypothetical protein